MSEYSIWVKDLSWEEPIFVDLIAPADLPNLEFLVTVWCTTKK